ncbi:DUF92 domain-containing protein [Chloroflexia bacterium SDU3-3]|nr:DUF92 domain-containing protein [Chloroflexia bacterium SDU3-3]
MISPLRIFLGLILSTLIGWIAYRRKSLTWDGWIGAVITGTLTFGFGGWAFGLTLIFFFTTSSLLSHYKQRRKQALAGEKFEKGGQRDFAQAMANGGVGALISLAFGLSGEPWQLLLFVGVLATVTADTWATELGILSSAAPHSILTMKPVPRGTSGGISLVGTAAGALGALAIGACFALITLVERGNALLWLPLIACVGGTCGNLADSLLGATVQAMYHDPLGNETERPAAQGVTHSLARGWRWMNNDAVNLLSSLIGGIVALLLYMTIS